MRKDAAERVKGNIWKIRGWANCYLIKGEENVLVDCGAPVDRDLVKEAISSLVGLENIKRVVFTHVHFDHVANWRLFPNACFFTSSEEIEDLKNDPLGSVVQREVSLDIAECMLNRLREQKDLKVIKTPGHTRGSVCLVDDAKKVIFTGDTYFREGIYGRTDLSNSRPDLMRGSIRLIRKYLHYTVCPGHDY